MEWVIKNQHLNATEAKQFYIDARGKEFVPVLTPPNFCDLFSLKTDFQQ